MSNINGDPKHISTSRFGNSVYYHSINGKPGMKMAYTSKKFFIDSKECSNENCCKTLFVWQVECPRCGTISRETKQ